MPIRIITGLPGHGKTLRMVDELHKEAARQPTEKEPRRPLFQCGIAGLEPGLATKLEDPTQWNARDPNGEPTCDCKGDGDLHAHVVPDGSLIFVDEAWKWYGHLHNASGQKTPEHVLAFAEHRHRGLDFVMTTQGPGQLYPFLRTLIEGHTHVVRIMGTQSANTFTWPELNDDVKSRTMREASTRSMWAYPTKRFDSYKSASQHTIKRNIPWKIVLIPLCGVLALVAGFYAYATMQERYEVDAPVAASGEAQVHGLPGASAQGRTKDATATERHEPAAVAEYFANFKPRNPALPASAPAYDERPVVAEPRLLCMVVGPGLDAMGQHVDTDRCFCRTEQYTVYEVEDALCRMRAVQGEPYDPFKRPAGDRWGDGRPDRDSQQTARNAGAPSSTVIEADQVSGYGDLGIALKPGTAN